MLYVNLNNVHILKWELVSLYFYNFVFLQLRTFLVSSYFLFRSVRNFSISNFVLFATLNRFMKFMQWWIYLLSLELKRNDFKCFVSISHSQLPDCNHCARCFICMTFILTLFLGSNHLVLMPYNERIISALAKD